MSGLTNYTPRIWQDGEPLPASALNRIEQGLGDVTDAVQGGLLADTIDAEIRTVLASILPEDYEIRPDGHLYVVRADGVTVDAGVVTGGGGGDSSLALAALASHVSSSTPHPAYDDPMNLDTYFENGLA